MGQSYFDFKQFRIEQGSCGMKVTTDACIQGAWTPVQQGAIRILDAGAGTGLLSLMLAQRAPDAQIDALELDEQAAIQAADNVAKSPFSNRVTIRRQDARLWMPANLYHLIICNPPFFMNSLKAPQPARTIARHDDLLTREDLLGLFGRALLPEGVVSVLLPLAEWTHFDRLAVAGGWHLCGQLRVQDRPAAAVKRVVSCYKRIGAACVQASLTIRDAEGRYTADFTRLLAPFYLHL